MVAFLASLLGHVHGGLHYVLVGTMYLVSGISGSKAADMAALAPVLFPEMKKRGAKPRDLGHVADRYCHCRSRAVDLPGPARWPIL
jgi:TRAP-type C4-dicarboxylate transport system permease large subunit